MTDVPRGAQPPSILDRAGYELEVEDTFAGPALDERLWFPHHLAGWSSREASAARYDAGSGLRLRTSLAAGRAVARLQRLVRTSMPNWCLSLPTLLAGDTE